MVPISQEFGVPLTAVTAVFAITLWLRLIGGGFVAPVLTYFAVNRHMGFALPMMIATMGSLVVLVISVFLGPETKGKVLTADLEVFKAEEYLGRER